MASEMDTPITEAGTTLPAANETRRNDSTDSAIASPASTGHAPTETSIAPTTVARPRAIVWEVVLCTATIGLYFSYYLYRLAKDLRTINGTPLSPIWWIFAPLFLLAQLFAYPYLMREMEKAESTNDLPQLWGTLGCRAWMIGMWAVTLLINISDLIPHSDSWFVAVFFIGVGLMATLHHRVNRIRAAHHQGQTTGHDAPPQSPRRFSIIEWLVTILFLPAAILLFTILLFPVQLFGGTKLETLQDGQQVLLDGHPFAITVSGDGWSQVEIGSHSDGTALIELEGVNSDAYFVVFEHGKDASLSGISEFRTELAKEEIFETDCEEYRQFIGDTTHVTSVLTCRGEFLGNSVVLSSKSIETEKGIYELYGQFITAKAAFVQHEDDFRNIAKGFLPNE